MKKVWMIYCLKAWFKEVTGALDNGEKEEKGIPE